MDITWGLAPVSPSDVVPPFDFRTTSPIEDMKRLMAINQGMIPPTGHSFPTQDEEISG